MLTQILVLIFVEILLISSVYRMTRLLVHETGVFGIFTLIRSIAGVKVVIEKRPNMVGQLVDTEIAIANNTVGKILTCFYCCSVWVSMPAAAVATYLSPDSLPVFVWAVIHWLAIAGAVAIIRDVQ